MSADTYGTWEIKQRFYGSTADATVEQSRNGFGPTVRARIVNFDGSWSEKRFSVQGSTPTARANSHKEALRKAINAASAATAKPIDESLI